MDKAELNKAYFETGDWMHTRYRGVPIFKYATDLYVYEQILQETEPDLIIECGTLEGGSALWLADHSKAQIITMDINDVDTLGKTLPVIFYKANSLDITIDTSSYKRVMVILDSDHRKDHVLAEIEKYAPLVSNGCYLVIEDTFISRYMNNEDGHNDYSGGSSWEAVQEWDKEGFIPDDKLSGMFALSMNPGGWWKRL